jgi:hypothetical protein
LAVQIKLSELNPESHPRARACAPHIALADRTAARSKLPRSSSAPMIEELERALGPGNGQRRLDDIARSGDRVAGAGGCVKTPRLV